LAPDRGKALRIIQSLREGKNCLEGASTFSTGRKALMKAALENLEELELSGSAVVRWVRGRTGLGKTHLFARLIEMAHERNWVTSYVQISEPGGGVELHRFQEIYSGIVGNCVTRAIVTERDGKVEPGAVPGWDWILDAWWDRVRNLAGGGQGELPSMRARDEVSRQMSSLRKRWSLNPGFQSALREYALAQADSDQEWAELLRLWFRGDDVHSRGGEVRSRLRKAGIPESVTQRNSKEMLRSLSAFLAHLGYGGVLVLIDELENVLLQPPKARRNAYTILREVIDNVDDRQGMVRTAFYVSATPDVLDSAKGISEYEALAERVLLPGGQSSNPAGAVLDLAMWPLERADFREMTEKIVALYGLAKGEAPEANVLEELRKKLEETLTRNKDMTARTWVRTVIDSLDSAHAARSA
jgi:hypothetical protein